MAISEGARKDLYTGLTEAIGPSNAETLMSVLPFYELDEVATKADIALLSARIDQLEIRLARVETEFAEFKAEVRHDLRDLRTEVRNDFSDLRNEVRGLRSTVYRLNFATLATIIGATAVLQLAG
jgi:hypothetical protein